MQGALPTALAPPAVLSAGIVAYNEEENLGPAVRSLLDQRLPDGTDWGEIWLVASGCTDRTEAVATALAGADPRIRVITEPDRGGKARALDRVLGRAEGDALVLLNADARAEPGAVARLVEASVGKSRPFAIMGRPVVPGPSTGSWNAVVRQMWSLHHEFHTELLADGHGRHLSDELLLVSLPRPPRLPEGVINDGAYLAVWLDQHAGGVWYAPEAHVSIQTPRTVRDHIRQRRRIHVGNAQVRTLLGTRPATLATQFLRRPFETLRMLRRGLAEEAGHGGSVWLPVSELVSLALAGWDVIYPRKDHVHWERIGAPRRSVESSGATPPVPTRSLAQESIAQRVAALLGVAGRFGTGLSLRDLRTLLPEGGPPTDAELGAWLRSRPDLAELREDRVFPVRGPRGSNRGRAELGREYRRFAEGLWRGPLSFSTDLVRCAGITGSTAYGEPEVGDDVDFFVVTRQGALWWFLARAYFRLWLGRRRARGNGSPTVCLNFVLEDATAPREFETPRGLLFAREALSVRMLRGEPYYRGLLASAPWIRSELPRLYDERTGDAAVIAPEPAPLTIRCLNRLVFPFLATYLQCQGLIRNSRGRGADPSRGFRTETQLGRMVFASERFERLREAYGDAPAPPTISPGAATPARVPLAR